MRFQTFKEQMAPAECTHHPISTAWFRAKLGSLVVVLDVEMEEYQIYFDSELLLDMADIHTAKAFVRLARLMDDEIQRELKECKNEQ